MKGNKMYEYTAVPMEGFETLKDKVKKLNKRAKKIGYGELSIEASEPYFIKHWDEIYLNNWWEKVCDVIIKGEMPQYKNWIFVGTVEGYPNGKNILYINPKIVEKIRENVDIEKYRSEKSHCDHCKINRFRKNTFLIYNIETKELKTVGSTCIKDFFGHDIPTFNLFSKIMKEFEDGNFYDIKEKCKFIDLKSYLACACQVIKEDGFVSKKKAYERGLDPTVDTVNNYYFDKNIQILHNFKIEDYNRELAEKVFEWGKPLKDRENLNDYLYSLSVIFENECFEIKAAGFVVSSIHAYKNEMNLYETKKESNYVGEVKKRYEFELNIDKLLPFQSDFGVVFMHCMSDNDGNQFVWFGSKVLINGDGVHADTGDVVKIKGTVKCHKEYKGIKQTQLTRCSLLEIVKKA